MNVYQVIVIIMLSLPVGANLYKWLEKKQTFAAALGAILVQAFWAWVLWSGGFFAI